MGPLPLCLYNQHDRFRGNQYHLSIKIWYNTMQIHSNLRFTMENCHKMGVCHISIHTQRFEFPSSAHRMLHVYILPFAWGVFPPLRCFCSLVPWGEVAVDEVNVILVRCRSWIECLHIGCFPDVRSKKPTKQAQTFFLRSLVKFPHISTHYPLVNFYKTMENHHCQGVNPP